MVAKIKARAIIGLNQKYGVSLLSQRKYFL